MEKLPRLTPKNGYFTGPYTTGDAQDWTYEYTWEDLLATFDNDSSSESSMENTISCNIRRYFAERPEKLQAVTKTLEVAYGPHVTFKIFGGQSVL